MKVLPLESGHGNSDTFHLDVKQKKKEVQWPIPVRFVFLKTCKTFHYVAAHIGFGRTFTQPDVPGNCSNHPFLQAKLSLGT